MNHRKELDLHFYLEDQLYEDDCNQNGTEPIVQNQIVALSLIEKEKPVYVFPKFSLDN